MRSEGDFENSEMRWGLHAGCQGDNEHVSQDGKQEEEAGFKGSIVVS